MDSAQITKTGHRFSFCHLLITILYASGMIACSQPGGIYDDLTGDYEHYSEGKYTPARVFVRDDSLLFDVGVGITLVLEPVNLNRLRFRSEWEGELFEIL